MSSIDNKPDFGSVEPGGVDSEIALLSGSDTVAENTGTSASLAIGGSVVGYLNSTSDEDWFEVTLVAGETYNFSLDGSGGSALSDPLIRLYNSGGTQIASNDDGGAGRNSLLSFTATTSGTYYIAADAYSSAGVTSSTGQYTISASIANPLDAIDWGTTVTPTGGVISVYFAGNGESFDGVTSQGWSAYEIQQAMAAFGVYEDVIDVTFQQVNNSAAADFNLVTTTGVNYLGYFNPPGTTNAGVGVFNTGGTGWNTTGGLDQGGYGFITLIHEFGHAMGLAHPHDNGGTSAILNGVTSSQGDLGDDNLNQGIYTTMSYNDGWQAAPHGTPSVGSSFGWQGTLMAFDIAALQGDYGANTTANGANNAYQLVGSNATGTYYESIWDTGGTDTIQYSGALAATINLNAATLGYDAAGGGYVSYVTGIHGGFTIADGAVIENATGGTGNDLLIGNSVANILDGGAGGNDTASFANDTSNLTIDLDAGTAVSTGSGNNTLISIENATGGSGNDSITGAAGTNVLSGGGGNDTFFVDNDDQINGGSGTDTLFVRDAAGGNLTGLATSGVERFYGGNLNDIIDATGATGNLYFNGGFGNDILRGGNGVDLMFGRSDDDVLVGNGGSDRLYGDGGADKFYGGAGNDRLFVDSDDLILNGGSGTNDQVYVRDSGGVVFDDSVISISGVERFYGGSAIDVFTLANSTTSLYLNGGGGNDVMTGGSARDLLLGRNGNDELHGGGGNDNLYGDRGNDKLYGDAGNDKLYGYQGADEFYGGAGNDEFFVDRFDTVFSGGSGNDRLYIRDTGGMTLSNLGDTDIERFFGNSGADVLDGSGATYSLILDGGGNNDVLTAGDAGDFLYGRSGNDRLVTGGGFDRLSGNSGRDTFEFTNGTGADKVLDWEHGIDTLDFSNVTGVNGVNDLAITYNSSQTVATIRYNDGSGVVNLTVLSGGGAVTTITDSDFNF